MLSHAATAGHVIIPLASSVFLRMWWLGRLTSLGSDRHPESSCRPLGMWDAVSIYTAGSFHCKHTAKAIIVSVAVSSGLKPPLQLQYGDLCNSLKYIVTAQPTCRKCCVIRLWLIQPKCAETSSHFYLMVLLKHCLVHFFFFFYQTTNLSITGHK